MRQTYNYGMGYPILSYLRFGDYSTKGEGIQHTHSKDENEEKKERKKEKGEKKDHQPILSKRWGKKQKALKRTKIAPSDRTIFRTFCPFCFPIGK